MVSVEWGPVSPPHQPQLKHLPMICEEEKEEEEKEEEEEEEKEEEEMKE